MDNPVMSIPMGEIDADERFNCRGVISAIDVVDLAKDIKEKGLLQPVIVSKITNTTGRKKYRLIGGFRRFTAHQVNQADSIYATIMETVDEAQATILNLSENLNRQDLTLMQEARAVKRLRDLGIGEVDTATRINKTRGWVQVRFMLLSLPDPVQKEVDAGLIKQTDIRELYSIQHTVGDQPCVEAALKLKDAKERGVKISVRPKAKTTKKIRMKVEITEMLEHIFDTLGPNLGTRCLAWAGGEISDGELFVNVKEEAEILGKNYVAPY